MTHSFNSEALKELLTDDTRICISLFMPMHKTGETTQNANHIKNLMRDAQKQLVVRGMEAAEVQQLLQPVHDLLEDADLWHHPGDGLAIFCSPTGCKHFRVPIKLEEQAVVAEHFYVAPLLSLTNGNGRFYVLALSQNDVRFFRGDRERIQEVPLDAEVPHSLADALKYDEADQPFIDRNPAFGAGMAYHGQSEAKEDHKEKLGRFFNLVDKGLHKILKEENAPLMLAGVEYLLPIYRSNTIYAHVLEVALTGNPETLSPQELHERAWPLVQPLFEETQHQAVERFREAAGTTNLTSIDVPEIVSAANFGQIDTLFVAQGTQQFGVFDTEANQAHLHRDAKTGDEDLVNLAAMQTLLHSGTVYTLPPDAMPANTALAAMFRYETV